MRFGPGGRLIAADGRWHFGIGDSNVMGWVTVVAYAVVAVLCVRAWMSARRAEHGLAGARSDESENQATLKHLWVVVTIVVVALGINKQLDLQTLGIDSLTDRARSQGWYDDRRRYQLGLVVVLLTVAPVVVVVVAYRLRRVATRAGGALLGLTVLVVFVALRAVNFHVVDEVVDGSNGHLNWVLELSGSAVIGVAAVRAAVDSRRRLDAPSVAAVEPRGAVEVSSAAKPMGAAAEPVYSDTTR